MCVITLKFSLPFSLSSRFRDMITTRGNRFTTHRYKDSQLLVVSIFIERSFSLQQTPPDRKDKDDDEDEEGLT